MLDYNDIKNGKPISRDFFHPAKENSYDYLSIPTTEQVSMAYSQLKIWKQMSIKSSVYEDITILKS